MTERSGRLQDKVVVLTGAARGLGRACALLFAEEGARLVVTDVDADNVEQTAALVRENGGAAVALRGDVADLADHRKAVETAVAEFGRLDVMFNNAGVAPRGAGSIAFEDLGEDDLRTNVEINFLGSVFAAHAAVPQMRQQGGGTILFTSSASAHVAFPNFGIYGASKAGVNGLVRALAVDLGKYGIRVNCLSPLFGMNIDFTRSHHAPDQPLMMDKARYELADWDPAAAPMPLKLSSPPTLRDNALAALFLASDETRYVSGISLVATDGGTLAKVAM
jgi:NAD(P)-dependent dehydrogenase (short-subunit alcohol dehydrogenase family)